MLRQRADSGELKAIYDLAGLYERGYGDIPRDTLAADSLYLYAAEKGYAPAQNYVGFKYYLGNGFPKNLSLALEWIGKAAAQGDAKAYTNLGWLLMEGEGIEHDYTNAAYWLERAVEAGLPVSMAQLGDLYRTGRGVEQDTVKARNLYEASLRGGFTDAQLQIADMDYRHFLSLTPQEQVKLGKYYRSMGGYSLAITLFDLAAGANLPEALTLMGDAYSRGVGVPYNHNLSLSYFFRGARGGNPSAMFVLAELLDMFPDALTEIESEIEPPLSEDERSAAYWYAEAGALGVENAGQATSRLYSPD